MQIAEKYLNVNHASSDELRTTARASLNDVGTALRAYSREASFATRLWCHLWKYDLDVAAGCLFGLAQTAFGTYSISEEQRKNAITALYVSLGATRHLTQAEVDTVRRQIAEVRGASLNAASPIIPSSDDPPAG